jgi:hypothetical protein
MVSTNHLRKSIAMVLAFSVILVHIPISKANDLPEMLYFENSGEIFKLDLTDFLENYEEVATATGTLQVIMSRAVFSGAPPPRAPIFVFSKGTPNDFPVLGTTAREVLQASGLDIAAAQEWAEVVSYSFTSTEAAFISSYRVGADTFTMTVPKVALRLAMKDLTPDIQATVEVNGALTYVEMATFYELAAHMGVNGEIPRHYDLPQSISNLALEFEELTRLVNGYQGFQFAAHTLRNRSLSVHSKDDSCVDPCLECAATLVASIGTAVAIYAACGSAIFTGGATLAACVAAFIAHNVTHFMVLGTCADCYQCVTEPEPDECACVGMPDCDCD